MSKVTAKLQVTIPKVIAQAHALKPGSHVRFESAGDVIRLHPGAARMAREPLLDLATRLAMFDEDTRRQAERDRRGRRRRSRTPAGRGWRREDLYSRGLPR